MSGKGVFNTAACGMFLGTLLLALVTAGCGGSGTGAKARKGVITMAPHITETVFALGQGKRVIAVGSFDDYPLEVANLPKVGGYIDPDLEKITMLNPALIIVAGEPEKLMQYARLQQAPVLSVNMDSLETIDSGIGQIGAALDCSRAATRLRGNMHKERASIEAAVKDLPRPKVLIIVSRQTHNLNTLNTVGGTSFVSEIVSVAGGDNIYGDTQTPYIEASKETVVMRAPDVILEFHCGESLTEKQTQAYYNDWAELPTLPAFKRGAIYFITESYGMRPGPRIYDVAKEIAKLLHSGKELKL